MTADAIVAPSPIETEVLENLIEGDTQIREMENILQRLGQYLETLDRDIQSEFEELTSCIREWIGHGRALLDIIDRIQINYASGTLEHIDEAVEMAISETIQQWDYCMYYPSEEEMLDLIRLELPEPDPTQGQCGTCGTELGDAQALNLRAHQLAARVVALKRERDNLLSTNAELELGMLVHQE